MSLQFIFTQCTEDAGLEQIILILNKFHKSFSIKPKQIKIEIEFTKNFKAYIKELYTKKSYGLLKGVQTNSL